METYIIYIYIYILKVLQNYMIAISRNGQHMLKLMVYLKHKLCLDLRWDCIVTNNENVFKRIIQLTLSHSA